MATPSVPGAINVPAPLQGNEIVAIATGGPQSAQTTTAAIAALASVSSGDQPVAITAAVGTTITAAQIIQGLLNRSGPTANYTDTTDTAVALYAASGSSIADSFYVAFKNATAFNMTLAGGIGVTFSSSTIVPPNSFGSYLVTFTSATAAVFNHADTTAISTKALEITTALTTVGAGTITGAGIAGGVTLRSGSTTAFTDTTDTAAAIILAQPNTHVGDSWEYTYQNNTVAVATIAAGSGVTLTGALTVPPNSWIRYLITYTAAGAVSMAAVAAGFIPNNSGTFVNNGVTPVTTANANFTASSQVLISLKTVGGTVGAIPHLETVTPGTGFTTIGTASDTSTYNYTILG